MSFISLVRQARYEENSKLYSRAFNTYSKAISLTKDLKSIIRLQNNKGICMQIIGNHEQAVEIFNSMYKNYTLAESFLYPSIYFYKLKKTKLAKTILLKGIEVFPDYLELYITLASILKETERSNESIQILKQALSREKLINGKGGIGRKDIWAELGSLYFERGNYNSCILCLKKSLGLDKKENFLHYQLLAKSYLILNDPYSALKYIDSQLMFFEDFDTEDFITKARAHARLGENHLASANLLQAIDSDGFLKLNADEMTDFSQLMKNGFFNTIENFEIQE